MKKSKEIAYLANTDKEEDLIYFDTISEKNVAHVNIGTEDRPYYLPQEMFKVTDSYREFIKEYWKNGKM